MPSKRSAHNVARECALGGKWYSVSAADDMMIAMMVSVAVLLCELKEMEPVSGRWIIFQYSSERL